MAAKEILRFGRFLVNGEKRNGDRTSLSLPLEGEGGPSKTGDEVDPYFCTNKSPFRQRRNIIARRAISFPQEISFAEGKHHCRRRRLGGAKPRPRTGWGSPAGSPRFVFCLQKTKPSPPRSYGCSAHFAEKRKFKDFGLKSFDLTGEKFRPAVREGFPERTA